MPPQPQWPQLAPLPLASDVGASFHSADARNAQLAESGQQGPISKPPIGRDDDAALAHGWGHTPHRPADDRQFVAFQTSFSYRGLIGAPVNRHSATAHHERDPKQMLIRFNRPVNGQAHFAGLG
jgi:hypothetical protein